MATRLLGATNALGAMVSYASVSMSMTLINKALVRSFGVTESLSLLGFQALCGLVLLFVGKRMGWLDFEIIRLNRFVDFLPLNVFFILMLLTSFQR